MVLLDTDHMSLLQRGGAEEQRMSATRSRCADGELKKLLQSYCSFAVLDYGAGAAEFQRLLALKIRIGTMDLKIAAITLAVNATLLTRNIVDFGKVPALRVEDWSV